MVLFANAAFAQGGASATKTSRVRLATSSIASSPAKPAADLSEASKQQVLASYARLPLSFEVNQGQSNKQVKFLSHGRGYTLFLTPTEAVLALEKSQASAAVGLQPSTEPGLGVAVLRAEALSAKSPGSEKPSYAALFIKLIGANPATKAEGQAELPGKSNYFIGKDPKQWHTDVRTFGKVMFHAVYPGVDVVYYGNQQQLEHDFIVAPGADPSAITLGIEGAEKISVDAQGDLVLASHAGEIRLKKPLVYQELDGIRKEIGGRYTLKGKHQVSFEVARYDLTKPLVIDPILAYSTYLGGTNQEDGAGIAVDSAGSAYVTGITNSINFPTTPGAFQTSFGSGFTNAFVTKLNAAGSALAYSTYLGGSSGAAGYAIAVDSAGSAYVTGVTSSSDFPTTPDAFQRPLGGNLDVFVTKLNAAGSALAYSTYLGGSVADYGSGIAVDSAASAYVTGFTYSSDFPTTPAAFQPTFGGSADSFVTKLNAAGSALSYSTYLGGYSNDAGYGIAVDLAGSAYVTGFTYSSDFPTTPGAFQSIFGDSYNKAFVTKLNVAGSALAYSSYLGGSFVNYGRGIAVDSAGSAYVTGFTTSSDFPTTPGAFQTAFGGLTDAFVTKLNAAGSALAYSTYLGGNNFDGCLGIALDSAGSAYVTGGTSSSDFPTTPDAIQSTFGVGDNKAFVTRLNVAGSALAYSTYLGGSFTNSGRGIAVDSAGSAYVTGTTSSIDFPATPGAFQTAFNGNYDAFVAKFTDVISVAIDIKPGEKPASLNPGSKGKIPVAILSTSTFDATTQVDRTSLTFGHTGNEKSLDFCNGGKQDVNGDGLPDLVCHFDTAKAAFQAGDTMGFLKGHTITGVPIQGSDAIRIVPSAR